ncbi:MAG: hypothetical protein B7Y39_09975 [Bdellovibrio sp. 28-41-41]|nr:MAG: hypothetical protein B7Y39_09975 [Bdellovibrio sp. 28-41-41]
MLLNQSKKGGKNMNRNQFFFYAVLTALIFIVPEIGFASVESSLMGIQTKLTRVILPSLSICAIAWAAFSMMSGNDKSKTHLWYAIIATIVGFGAEAIVNFISQTVR